MPVTSPTLPPSTWDRVSGYESSSRSLCIQQTARMPRDHQVLIGGYHPSRHGGAGARDLWAAFGIGLLIQRDAEPLRLEAGTRPYLGGVLADARGEHECVQSAERPSKRPELASEAVD